MGTVRMCASRKLRELGRRQIGFSIPIEWVREVELDRGDSVGVELDGDRVRYRLGTYEANAVGWEVTLGDRDGTPVVTLPAGARHVLPASEGERLLLHREGPTELWVEVV